MKDSFIHLTNYSINKTSKKFIFNKSEGSMGQGHKRSLTSVFDYLKKIGVDIGKVKD